MCAPNLGEIPYRRWLHCGFLKSKVLQSHSSLLLLEHFDEMLRSNNATLSSIGPVSCHIMATTEKQMKGVATWGRSGTFINTLRHSVSARRGKCLSCAYQRQSYIQIGHTWVLINWCSNKWFLGFKVITTMWISVVGCVVTIYKLGECYQRFGGTYCRRSHGNLAKTV